MVNLMTIAAVSTAVAAEVPWEGGRIVIDNPGSYTLSAPATATEVRFNADASVTGGSTLTLASPSAVSGRGVNAALLTPLAGTDGMTVVNRAASASGTYPQKNSRTLLWSGLPLSAVQKVQANICGYWLTGSVTEKIPVTHLVAYTETVADAEATMELQAQRVDKGRNYAVKVKFSYEDGNTFCELMWVKWDIIAHGRLGQSMEGVVDKWEGADVVQTSAVLNPSSFGSTTVGITDFKIGGELTVNGESLPSGTFGLYADNVTLAFGANAAVPNFITGVVEKLTFKGPGTGTLPTVTLGQNLATRNTPKGQMVLDGVKATVMYNFTPENADLILTNGATFTTGSYTYNNEVLPTKSQATIYSGCKMTLGVAWTVANDAKVVVDGGELSITSTGTEYFNHLVLRNGGGVSGSGNYYAAGYTTASKCELVTFGDGVCVVEPVIRARGKTTNGDVEYLFDTAANLRLLGGLGHYGADPIFPKWVKRGQATLSIEGTGHWTTAQSTMGTFKVEEGTVALGCNDAFSRTNALTLAGGTLDVGAFTNRLGTLTLTANSTIAVGNGCLTFSDSSAVGWDADAKLNVVGEAKELATGHLRFLGTGLTETQLKALRYNGRERMSIDDNGWVTSVDGFLLLYR